MRFSKTGKAKYISHLDLMATMRRSLTRAGVRLQYSEGFNPHPYMSVALPLPIGCGSVCELMDIGVMGGLQPDGLADIINAALPEGLEILEVYLPLRKFNGISWIEIDGVLYYDNEPPSDAVERLNERFDAESIVISKKTKSGVIDIDIVPHIQGVRFSSNGEITMKAVVSAQNPTINADNLISSLGDGYTELVPDFSLFTRVEVFDVNMCAFR